VPDFFTIGAYRYKTFQDDNPLVKLFYQNDLDDHYDGQNSQFNNNLPCPLFKGCRLIAKKMIGQVKDLITNCHGYKQDEYHKLGNHRNSYRLTFNIEHDRLPQESCFCEALPKKVSALSSAVLSEFAMILKHQTPVSFLSSSQTISARVPPGRG
jgi:hypothetical protein